MPATICTKINMTLIDKMYHVATTSSSSSSSSSPPEKTPNPSLTPINEKLLKNISHVSLKKEKSVYLAAWC